jgi:hypothetical protein
VESSVGWCGPTARCGAAIADTAPERSVAHAVEKPVEHTMWGREVISK